jgi:hypothetical protein
MNFLGKKKKDSQLNDDKSKRAKTGDTNMLEQNLNILFTRNKHLVFVNL